MQVHTITQHDLWPMNDSQKCLSQENVVDVIAGVSPSPHPSSISSRIFHKEMWWLVAVDYNEWGGGGSGTAILCLTHLSASVDCAQRERERERTRKVTHLHTHTHHGYIVNCLLLFPFCFSLSRFSLTLFYICLFHLEHILVLSFSSSFSSIRPRWRPY